MPREATKFRGQGRLDVDDPAADRASAQWLATVGDPPDPAGVLAGAVTVWKRGTEAARGSMHNFVHSCPQANAFYVDDGDSGDTIIVNLIVNAACGPFVGGGHFNTVRNNIVVHAPIGIHLDARGVTRGYDTSGTHPGRLARFRTDLPPWSQRNPALRSLTTLDAGLPHGNVVSTNVTIDCGIPLRRSGRPEHLADNRVEEPLVLSAAAAAFTDPALGDFSLRADSAIYADLPAFKPIPFATIGFRSEAPNERRERRATTLGATATGADDGVTSLDDIRATDARGPSSR